MTDQARPAAGSETLTIPFFKTGQAEKDSGRWYVTDFTKEQIEGRIASLESALAEATTRAEAAERDRSDMFVAKVEGRCFEHLTLPQPDTCTICVVAERDALLVVVKALAEAIKSRCMGCSADIPLLPNVPRAYHPDGYGVCKLSANDIDVLAAARPYLEEG